MPITPLCKCEGKNVNLEVLKMGFKAYLEEKGKIDSESSSIKDSDISIFMYANDFKDYIGSSLSGSKSEIQSKSISDILKMEFTPDGKLVDPEELAAYNDAIANGGEVEDNENIENNEQPVAAVSEESPSTEGNKETNQTEEPDLFTEIFNELLQDDAFKSFIDTDESGDIDNKELLTFLNGIKGNDGNADDVSIDDLLTAIMAEDDIDVRTPEEKAAEEAAIAEEKAIAEEQNLPTTNSAGEPVSVHQGSDAVRGAGSGGRYDNSGNFVNNTEPKTLDNMTKEELESEKKKAEGDLSTAKSDYDTTVTNQEQLVETAYEDYQEALEQIEGEDKELAEEVASLNEQIHEQEQIVDDQDKIITEQDSIISDCDSRIDAADTQITSLNGLLKELESKDGKTENGEKNDFSSQISNVKSQIDAAEKEKEAAEKDKAAAEKAKTEAETAKTDAEAKIKELEPQLTEKETELIEKHPELKEFKDNYDKAKETKTTEIDKAKQAMTDAQNHLNEVNTALTNYETKETLNKNTPNGMVDGVKSAIETAFSQLGIYEDAGNNRGTMEKYGAGAGNPWCAAFVSWVYGQDGNCPLNFTASVSGLKSQGEQAGYYSSAKGYTPVAGDIMIQKENGSSHTGIVVGCDGQYVYTIEGNSSDAVRQRRYSLGDYSKISGYIRMNEWMGGSSNVDSTAYLSKVNNADSDKYNKTT